jgi:hypothetical protein
VNLSPIDFIFIQNISLMFGKKKNLNLYPHGHGGGTCYRLMKAIDPGATEINFIIVFMPKISSNDIFVLIASAELNFKVSKLEE